MAVSTFCDSCVPGSVPPSRAERYHSAGQGYRHTGARHLLDHSAQLDELINEVGTKDVWPVLAETVTTGYGSAGTYGFRRKGVRDRWHNGKTHSAFLTPEFCDKYWAPFLRDGTIIEDDARAEPPPWWLQIVRVIQPRF